MDIKLTFRIRKMKKIDVSIVESCFPKIFDSLGLISFQQMYR